MADYVESLGPIQVPALQYFISDGAARATVTTRLDEALTQAKTLTDEAKAYLAAIKDFNSDFDPIKLTQSTLSVADIPNPDVSDITMDALDSITSTITTSVPELTDVDEIKDQHLVFDTFGVKAPTLPERTPSAVNSPTAPGEPPGIDAVTIGEAPDYDVDSLISKVRTMLDGLDTLPNLTLPDAPADFTITDLTLNFATPQYNLATFKYNEVDYTSELGNRLRTKLMNLITNGGYAYDASVDDAIFERARNRVDLEFSKQHNNILTKWSNAGWRRPPGQLNAELKSLVREWELSKTDTFQKIMEQQAAIAMSNFQLAITSGVKHEEDLMNHFNRVKDRALEAAKALFDKNVEYLKFALYFNEAQLMRLKAHYEAQKIKLEARLLKMQEWLVYLEANKLKLDVDLKKVELVFKEIDAVNLAYLIYKTKLEAAKLKVDVNSLKLQSYGMKLQNYKTAWEGEKLKLDTWLALLQGDGLKAEIYKAQAQAYAAGVGGKATEIAARKDAILSQLAIKEAEIKVYLAEVEKVSSFNSNIIANNEIKLKKYQTNISKQLGYNEALGRVGVARAQIAGIVKSHDDELVNNKSRVDIANLEATKEEMRNKLQQLIEMSKIYVGWISSLYAAVGISASVSDSENTSNAISYSYNWSDAISNQLTESYSQSTETTE